MFLTKDGDLLAWIMLIPVISLFGFGVNNTEEPIYIVLLTGWLLFGFFMIYKIVNKLKKNNLFRESYGDYDYYITDEEF
jgi:hypothetical protein